LFVPIVCLGGLLWLASCSLSSVWPWSEFTSVWRKWQADCERNDELERLRLIVCWRNQSKQLVLHEVLDGRLSLLEAASWIHRIYTEPARLSFWGCHPMTCNRNLWSCQHVITGVDSILFAASDPRRREKVKELEAELQRHQTSNGNVILPPPPPLATLPCCPVGDDGQPEAGGWPVYQKSGPAI
jgi:hypothetical protein